MANKKGGDNKYMRRIKNENMIGAGVKDTQEERLKRDNTIEKKIEEIKKQKEAKDKDK